MKLEIIIATKDEYENAIPSLPAESHMADICGYYSGKLAEAADAGIECIDIRAVEISGKISGSFQSVYNIEKPLMDFLAGHILPKKIRVVCKNDEQERLYKVVYNYFYADTHDGRMEVDHIG